MLQPGSVNNIAVAPARLSDERSGRRVLLPIDDGMTPTRRRA
jgi:hypothetical protein